MQAIRPDYMADAYLPNLSFRSLQLCIVVALSTTFLINKNNIISPHRYKALARGFYWKGGIWKCIYFPPEWLLVQRGQCSAGIKIVPIKAGGWNANTIKSGLPIQPFSPPPNVNLTSASSCVLMRNHSEEHGLIYANTLSALICWDGICLY